MTDQVRLDREGPIARITLSNPDVRNALTWTMYAQLADACDEVCADGGIRAVVIRGDGGRAFAAGTDIAQFTEFDTGADGVEYERRIGHIIDKVAALPMPSVAVVDGPAVGGGLAIAAMCDLILATPDAFFAVPVARTLGNCISAGLLARLYSALGRSRTLSMLLTARRISVEEAHTAGFVHAVVDAGELEAELTRLLERLQSHAPLTMAAVKAADRLLRAAAVDDADIIRSCYGSRDFQEGVAAFLERRKPQWEGR
jgi:enoyl-CoA hydratase/carnithine racemase